MSSVLNRKKKKMQPLGYEEGIHIFNQRKVRTLNYAREMANKTFLDMKIISYQILHDKFGFGLKRIKRLESELDVLLDGEVSCDEMVQYLSKKKGIDLADVDIPQRELLGFQGVPYNNNILPLENKIKVIAGTVSDYIVLSVTALRTAFKFSKNQIRGYVDWIAYYINSISRKYVDMLGVACVLYQECNYCDERFVGRFYEI